MTDSLYIDGKWQAGSREAFASTDPATGDRVWDGAAASPSDVDAAFNAARKAARGWANTAIETRINIAQKFKAIIADRKDEIGALISRETGKLLWDATGEAGVLAPKVDISVRAYEERTGAKSFDTDFGRAQLRHHPHGVMAVLGPYNFPAHLPNGQIIPALIAGNTIVFKPSEQTPATGQALMQAYIDAGFPPGVVNLVQGARAAGEAVLANPQLDGVLFTGSAKTGAMIHKQFGGRPEVVLALEMGGNNPLIAWDVKDAETAARIIIPSAFITTGQRCTCARRLIVPAGKAGDVIIDALADMTDRITLGSFDDNAFMGPLISADIANYVAQSAAALPGKIIHAGGADGAFIRPHIVDVTGHNVADEEIFGPVLQVTRAPSFEVAIDIANGTKFGLAAGLISDDAALWDIFARDIHAGVVNFNRPTTGASGALPFGGPGASGNHNPGAYYAADFCAWPMASQISDKVNPIISKGLK